MNKTQIEWTNYTINPVKGMCPVACPYCYARAMYKRFKWNPEIRFDWSVANDLSKMKAGSRVFWGSTIELFGDWVDPEWMRLIFEAVKRHSNLTHIFLTKQPQNLIKFNPFPENCYVGVSATNHEQYKNAILLADTYEAKVKFISFEPLLEMPVLHPVHFLAEGIKWVIIGAQTKPYKPPKIEWVQEIVEACDKAGIPVFLKDNLASLIYEHDGFEGKLRQEMPGVD